MPTTEKTEEFWEAQAGYHSFVCVTFRYCNMLKTSIFLLLAIGGTIPSNAQQIPKNLNIQRFPLNTDTDRFQPNLQQQPLLENKLGSGNSTNYHTCPKGTHEVAEALPELVGEIRAVDGVEFSPDGTKMRFTYNGKSCSK